MHFFAMWFVSANLNQQTGDDRGANFNRQRDAFCDQIEIRALTLKLSEFLSGSLPITQPRLSVKYDLLANFILVGHDAA